MGSDSRVQDSEVWFLSEFNHIALAVRKCNVAKQSARVGESHNSVGRSRGTVLDHLTILQDFNC